MAENCLFLIDTRDAPAEVNVGGVCYNIVRACLLLNGEWQTECWIRSGSEDQWAQAMAKALASSSEMTIHVYRIGSHEQFDPSDYTSVSADQSLTCSHL